MRRAVRRASRGLLLHDARHAYARLSAEAGVPIHDLEVFVGHSTIQATLDLYRHLYPEARTACSTRSF